MKAATLFISGVLTTAYVVVSICFGRFWRQSGDRLFAWFAAAFALLAVQRVVVTFAEPAEAAYLLRLGAFLLIMIAIADKNRAAR
jgi:hypothetical protein